MRSLLTASLTFGVNSGMARDFDHRPARASQAKIASCLEACGPVSRWLPTSSLIRSDLLYGLPWLAMKQETLDDR
jgi:hypothetical protein